MERGLEQQSCRREPGTGYYSGNCLRQTALEYNILVSGNCALLSGEYGNDISSGGQLSRKYKALMGILAYFGVMFVNMVVSYIVQFVLSFKEILFHMGNYYGSNNVNMAANYDSTLVVSLIMGVSMYFISHYILTKKLNMD